MNIHKDLKKLIDAAVTVRKNAAAKYSNFPVGAALEDSEGMIWTGCNVESSSYGLSVCAERIAIFKALSEGRKKFSRIVIAATGNDLVFPCGACRQVIHDFAPDIEVYIFDPSLNKIKSLNINELYPYPFGDNNLSGGTK